MFNKETVEELKALPVEHVYEEIIDLEDWATEFVPHSILVKFENVEGTLEGLEIRSHKGELVNDFIYSVDTLWYKGNELYLRMSEAENGGDYLDMEIVDGKDWTQERERELFEDVMRQVLDELGYRV